MSYGTWYTKEDVLKDLAVASGGRVENIDDGFVAIGERPPPPPAYHEDDHEIKLMFGQTAGANLYQNEVQQSDLNGITKMIRMVQDYEATTDEEPSPGATSNSDKNDIIIISKLNPNVQEFIPRGMPSIRHITTNRTNHDKVIIDARTDSICNNKTNKNNNDKISIDLKTDHIINTNDANASNSLNISKKKLDVSKCDIDNTTSKQELHNDTNKQKEIEEMAKMLRNKICNVKADSFEMAKEKNSAIAKLLRLFASSAPETTTGTKPVKLYTPQFFEKCKATDYQEIDDKTNVANTNLKPTVDNDLSPVRKTDRATFFQDNIKKNEINIEESNAITLLTPDMLKTNTVECSDNIPSLVIEKPLDLEVSDSITKVNDWFEKKPAVALKEKPKSRVVHLETVAFKRKDPATCKSPSEIGEKKISKPSDEIFKPSKYAEELRQKYEDRLKNKNAQIISTMNIWEKLEHDLKEKDLKIKESRKNNETETSDNSALNGSD